MTETPYPSQADTDEPEAAEQAPAAPAEAEAATDDGAATDE